MIGLLREKLLEVLQVVAPLILSVCVLQFTIVHAPTALFVQFLIGSVLAIVGMLLLFVGIDLGIVPMGKFVGAELPKKGSIVLIITVAFAIAFVTTMPEPDVMVLSTQVDAASKGAISGRTVLYVISLGLATLAALAMARIIFGWPMRYLLAIAYLLSLALAVFAPPQFVPLAFDGGSVTTGVLSAPVIIAVAIGVSSVLAGRSAVSDGFGLVGFASIGPIIAILLMGLLRA
jgi:hypothetical protein